MKTINDTYNIISLEVLDFKRIGAASLIISDGVTKITGANGAGKSSVIDAILYALKANGVEMPVRDGCARAKITLRIGGEDHGYTIERTIVGGEKYLKVTNDDGKPIASPQTFLSSLYKETADPMVFMNMKPRDQCDALRLACNCDTRSIEVNIASEYNERTVVNRRLAQAEAALLELGDAPEKVDVKSASELINKSNELQNYIRSVDDKFAIGQSYNTQLEVISKDMNSYETEEMLVHAEIEKLQKKLQYLDGEKRILNAKVAEINAAKDQLKAECLEMLPKLKESKTQLELVKQEIQGVDDHNRNAQQYELWCKQHVKCMDERNTAHTMSYNLTEKIKSLEADKRTLLESADYPVKGMTIEGDNVYVNNVPFSNLNTAEKIKVATFVAIAQNPKLKLIIIRNGSMLDDNSMNIVKDIAVEKGYQIIVEKVSIEPELDSIHIVEGKIQK